ncbi:MAG: undecaprenyl/decaprenyl-phosphate alpha-N-acetylglucosaminyl 1-phosphate transferase [Planctomycetes bacterium]|nr:undecaprenyl/decaprenyl-phosphate alpha-N-acetylglucosaminyl 1-phosphate transferase [Planctomycetota bacterium]
MDPHTLQLEVQVGLLLAGLLVSLVACPLAIRLSRRLGILDRPAEGKIHREPIPLLGGVAVFAAFYGVLLAGLAVGLLALGGRLGWTPPGRIAFYLQNIGGTGVLPRLGTILLAGAGIFALGLWDDLRRLPVWTRLLLQAALAGAVVAAGVRPEFFGLPIAVVGPLVVLWIVGITNAMNLLDGADGEAAGVGAISTGLLVVAMARLDQPLVVALLMVLEGALLGFLRFNFSPARIFLGSSGSMLIGYLLSVTVLEATFMRPGSANVLPVAMPILILGVPLYDTLGVMLIRLVSRRPLTARDTSHLQHRLMYLGMTQRQAVLLIYLFAFSLGINALVLVDLAVTDGLILLGQVFCVVAMVALLERAALRIIRIRTGVWREISQEFVEAARRNLERRDEPPMPPSPGRA